MKLDLSTIRPRAAFWLAAAWTLLFAYAVVTRDGAPFGTDVAVRDAVAAHGSGVATRIAGAVTQLGAGPVLYPLLLVLCLWAVARYRSARELLPLLGLVAGQVLELVLFATLRRPTPLGGSSFLLSTTFSSGHSSAAVLGWGLIAWQAARLRAPGSAPAAVRLWAFALTLGALVGATRVYLGLHWLSDAVAGVVVGAVLLAVALAGLSRAAGRPESPAPSKMWVPRRPAFDAMRAGRDAVRAGRAGRWLRESPWAWLVAGAAALVSIVPLLLTPAEKRMIDLLVYHGAGGWAGAGLNLYAFRTTFHMPFTYPPFAALVIEPLSRMPLGLAQALWTAATLFGVVALAATALRPVVDRIGLPLTVAVMLVTSPVRSHLHFGQVGVFLVLLVSVDLLREDGPARRTLGWGLGLATAIKLTPAVFFPWLLVTRQWKRLGGAVVWAAGATLLGLVLLWPSSGPYVFGASRDTSRFGHNDWPGNQSVRGMLLRALPDDPTAERIWLLFALGFVAVGTCQAWRCERHGNRLAAVGVLASLSVAVSPISWVHHLVWLALPIAALAAAGRWRLVAAWTAVLVISFPAIGKFLRPHLPALAEALIDVQGLTAVGAVLLLPALVGVRSVRRTEDYQRTLSQATS